MDEGYADDWRSVVEESVVEAPKPRELPEWVAALSEGERAAFASDILHSLTAGSIAKIIEEVQPRLHVDPVLRLPAELTFHVFSFLSYKDLLRAGETSRAWRAAALNPSLWRVLYYNIGWDASLQGVKLAEESAMDVDSSSLMLQFPNATKVNWQFLFKQRRRLECNWNDGRCKIFQIPHPQHMEEAHAECIYTIQYSGKYLLSGSRDRTLKIWDVESRRLVGKPLVGHTASVLCAQFDERPEEDIVISGSSDTNVIVWNFSTMAMTHKIEHAHDESVLNLRFDHRYLVTCSKDKTIKVWNRRILQPGDPEYQPNYGSDGKPAPHPAFNLLRTLRGHAAAVNAIQLHGDEIASASGDRHIKVWSVKTGQCLLTLSGHAKGIACVQFDGRRIITGSSDHSIRIFDRATGTEVSMLHGHRSLVRTVQAHFGDHPGSKEEDDLEARRADERIQQLRREGNDIFQARMTPGTRNSEDPSIYGASLPLGGGGSQLGRIVSGSYDETVIVWKRDAEKKKWLVNYKLRQEDALNAAAGAEAWRWRSPSPPPPYQLVPLPGENQAQTLPAIPTVAIIHQAPQPQPNPGMAKIFKLQFNHRQILCCSQDSRIVGWDFANGDAEILEACRFFQGN